MKDWTGNNSAFCKTLCASNHTDKERQTHDYYATEPKALELLLELEPFNNVWECACGEGHLSEVLKKHNIHSKSSDLIDRGYGEVFDFLSIENQGWDGDIVTNPPYKYVSEFIVKSLEIIKDGNKLALFLPIRYLEGKARKHIFLKTPPKTVYISSSRLNCANNGDFINFKSSTMAYSWIVWVKGFQGDTIIKWFN